jgi:aminoglycoside phosphotransferase (APT) family kinase protein
MSIMNPHLDSPGPVRLGEELDIPALQTCLQGRLPDLHGDLVVSQFPGGHSNLTYLLRFGARELVLRRPPNGVAIRSAHDMGREYRILSRLVDVYPRVPRPLLYYPDIDVLGAPFYVMKRIPGLILRAKPPEGIDLSSASMQRLSESFIDNLAEIHAVDLQAAGLGDLGKPQGYVERQISGWTQRYHNAQTDDIPAMKSVAGWLASHMPPESGAALIHNDYKYDNLLLNPEKISEIRGVLDWEMATIGDPLMDLGTTIGYWVQATDPPALQQARMGLTHLPGNLTRKQLVSRYAQKSGRDVSEMLFYYVYALFKIAVIVQQIYHRYQAGHSQDRRFASMIELVHVLGDTAQTAIDTGEYE